jgi:parallel beta-helix repeat protein
MTTFDQPIRRIVREAAIPLVMAISSLAIPSAAAAATYYVATNGNDGNSCSTARSASTPRRGINSTLSCLRAGDTLYIRAGVYAGGINSNDRTIPVGTSWSAAVTIAAYPGETVVLQPPGGDTVLNFAASYIQYVIFDGIIFDGANLSGGAVISLWGGANHVRFRNVEVKNSPAQGVTIFPGNGASSDYNEFINCRVHHNGRAAEYDHGFYIGTSNNLIQGCQVYSNKAFGVHIYNGSSNQANNNIVRNNRIYSNGTTGNNGGGVVVASGSSSVVYNNLIYGNLDGIVVCCGSRSEQVLNNTIHQNLRYGIEVQEGSGNVVSNNILRLNAVRDTLFHVSVTSSNNLSSDPMFANASAGDFRLRPGSPAIDTGRVLQVVTTDFAGVSRPQGSTHDIGAMESGTSSACPTTTIADAR